MVKKILYAIIFLATIYAASAGTLNCSYSTNPSYTSFNDIEWHCITQENTTCYTYVEHNNSLIQANPIPTLSEDRDQVIDGFECDGICTLLFSSNDLRTDRNVTFGAVCGNDSLRINVTPEFVSSWTGEQTMDRFIWIKDNISYIVMAILITFGIFAAIALMIKIILG